MSLARLRRAGELTAEWVPGPDREAVRDMARALEDPKVMEFRTRQRLRAVLLRHGRGLPGEVLADTGALPLARGSAIRSAGPAGGLLRVWGRGARGPGQDDRPRSPNALGARQLVATPHGRGPDKPAGRGNYHGEVDLELGHLTRFDTTCQLVSFLRLASSEHSSGSRPR